MSGRAPMIDKAVSAWSRFWFDPTSAATFVAIRTLVGLASLAWALSMLADLRTFYFDDGLLPAPNYAEHRVGLFQWLTSDTAVVMVWAIMVVASLSLVAGRWVRVGAPVLWLATCTMQQGAVSTLNAGDLLLRIWVAYLALYALFTPGRILDTPLMGRQTAGGDRTWGLCSPWFVRLVQIQLTVIYPATIIAKLEGDTWREGTAAMYALGLRDFARFWVPDVLETNLVLGNVMTWFTLGAEIALPFLLWTRRTRWAGIVLGIALHAGFDYAMRLGFFLPSMIIGYLSFVRPDEVERFLGRVRRGRGRDDATTAEADALVNA